MKKLVVRANWEDIKKWVWSKEHNLFIKSHESEEYETKLPNPNYLFKPDDVVEISLELIQTAPKEYAYGCFDCGKVFQEPLYYAGLEGEHIPICPHCQSFSIYMRPKEFRKSPELTEREVAPSKEGMPKKCSLCSGFDSIKLLCNKLGLEIKNPNSRNNCPLFIAIKT